jgi:hypothetical protein
LLPCSSESFDFPSAVQNVKIKIYRTIILPVVLYRRKTWSITLRKEPRLRMFENRVLRRIFGPKREKRIGRLEKITQRGASPFVLFTKY